MGLRHEEPQPKASSGPQGLCRGLWMGPRKKCTQVSLGPPHPQESYADIFRKLASNKRYHQRNRLGVQPSVQEMYSVKALTEVFPPLGLTCYRVLKCHLSPILAPRATFYYHFLSLLFPSAAEKQYKLCNIEVHMHTP